MRKRCRMLMLGVAGAFIITGCNAKTSTDVIAQAEIVNENSGGELTAMTKEQEELLKKISFNEEKVADGRLAEWQNEVLRQYEFAMDYLHEKYPSHSFHITDGDPKSKLNNYSTYWFTADNEEFTYELYLHTEDPYRCEDNFYTSILEPSYEKVLFDFLKEKIDRCIGVDSTMGSLQGKEIDETMDAYDLLEGNIQIPNNTVIFIDGTDVDAEMEYEQMKSLISQKEIYGSYIVIALTDFPEKYKDGNDLWEFVKEQGEKVYSLRESFSQWNS